MERYEPPDDPNNEPTRMAGYGNTPDGGYGGSENYYSDYDRPAEQPPGPPEPPPTPWYLRPAALIGWGVLTALLIVALIFGIVHLTSAKDSGHPTSTTTSSTTAGQGSETASTAASPTATEPAAPAATTTPAAPSPTTTTEPPTTVTTTPATTTTQPPTTATTESPATTPAATTPGGPIQLPSEITLPTLPSVIQLPPGL